MSTGTSVPKPRVSGMDVSDSALLATLLSEAPIGFAFVGADLRFRRVNQTLASLYGTDAGSYIGRLPSQVWPEDLGTRAEAAARHVLEADIRRAIERHELFLEYQPIIRLRDRQVTGFEALTRWMHPRRGTVPPSVFIPVAEDIGLMAQIGDQTLRAACQDAASWPDPLTVSVNVSARQLDDE